MADQGNIAINQSPTVDINNVKDEQDDVKTLTTSAVVENLPGGHLAKGDSSKFESSRNSEDSGGEDWIAQRNPRRNVIKKIPIEKPAEKSQDAEDFKISVVSQSLPDNFNEDGESSKLLDKDEVNNNLDDKEGGAKADECNIEATASWDVAGPSEVRTRNRTYVRSRSLCVRGPGDMGLTGADIRLLRERLVRTQAIPQPGELRVFSHQQRVILGALVLVDFMSFCSMSIMAPFFPREAGEKGMSEAVSGFVFSFYALVMFITSPIFGKILPIVGTKFLFLSGIFVAGSCNLLFGVLEYIYDYERFTMFCFLIRGLEALGASAYSTASYVYVLNTFPNNIGSVLGILETFVGLGMSVGPAIGGLLYSVGGFGLPFYVLGVAMVMVMPVIYWLLPSQEGCSIGSGSGSLLQLVKVPSVVITGLVIVVVSNTWAFLDPTLEPHLRQFNLSAEQVGLIFLLFSALYGLFSPIWGWLADKITSQWCMMFWGLVFCTVGLLLLGPSPLLPFLESSLWLNMIALSIISVSGALTLLPTFQGVLASSIEGGCSESLATYSIVAGVWSCMYSLGEVIGPSLGGLLLRNYGFPICSTVMAALTFILAIVTLTFFVLRDSSKLSAEASDTMSSDPSKSPSEAWEGSSGDAASPREEETSPLLQGEDKHGYGGTKSSNAVPKKSILRKQSNQNYTTENNNKVKNWFSSNKTSRKPSDAEERKRQGLRALLQSDFYQKYLDGDVYTTEVEDDDTEDEEFYQYYKEKVMDNVNDCCNNEVKYKKGDSGLLPKLCDSLLSQHLSEVTNGHTLCRKNSLDVLQYNVDKVKYLGKSRREDCEELSLDRNQVTDVRGTVNITSSGACEV